jgi:xylitol oxidase
VETNWAGNLAYGMSRLERPTSLYELQSLVANEPRVGVVGSRHSFSDIADTSGILINLGDMPQRVTIDERARCVEVSGGALYGEVARSLHRQGWALANLASLPHISVAGAVATGTHGSGDGNASLAAAVRSVDIVGPDGDIRHLNRGDIGFDGSVVALGALGVVTRLTLDIEPSFEVAQCVYLGLPWEALQKEFDDITSRAYSASFFTRWVGDHVDQVWLKLRRGHAAAPSHLFGASPATGPTHMLAAGAVESVTPQGGTFGPWLDRLPHFRMEFTPSHGKELQSEYLIPREKAQTAFNELRRLGPRIAPLIQASEIRTVAADNLWLSGSYGCDVVAVHFTWVPDTASVDELLPTLEAALLPQGGRPHWGKCFAVCGHELAGLYPRFDDFQNLRLGADPTGKFTNAFLDRTLGAVEVSP